MKKIITYTEEQISNITALLNGITITGIQNCKQLAVIVQILESGNIAEIKEDKKEGET